MLDLDGNTLAFMTAAMDRTCKQLKPDNVDTRKLLAKRIEAAARRGPRTMAAIIAAADQAVREINGSSQRSTGWWGRLRAIVGV